MAAESFEFLGDFHLLGHDLALNVFGLVLPLAVASGFWWARRQAARHGVPPEELLRVALWTCAGGLVGAWLVGQFADGHETVLEGRGCSGLSWPGAVVFGVVGLAGICRQRRLSFGLVADLVAPAAALAFAVGSLGCLGSGCCYGLPAPRWLPFAVELGRGTSAYEDLAAAGTIPLRALRTPPLHPTQLYEAAAALLVFALLCWRRSRRGQPASLDGAGRGLAWFLLLHPLLRLTVLPFLAVRPAGGLALTLGLAALGSGLTLWGGWRRTRPMGA